MKIDLHQKRLNAIKLRYYFFPRQCCSCRKEYAREKMYFVPCWGVNKKVWPYYYCQKCVKSKEDVLREIDDEEYGFGIAFVDDFPGRFPTKASSPMPDPNGT